MTNTPPETRLALAEQLEAEVQYYSRYGKKNMSFCLPIAKIRIIVAALRATEPAGAGQPVAWLHEITEPGEQPHAFKMYSASPDNPWSHWLQEYRDKCVYKATPLYALPTERGENV